MIAGLPSLSAIERLWSSNVGSGVYRQPFRLSASEQLYGGTRLSAVSAVGERQPYKGKAAVGKRQSYGGESDCRQAKALRGTRLSASEAPQGKKTGSRHATALLRA